MKDSHNKKLIKILEYIITVDPKYFTPSTSVLECGPVTINNVDIWNKECSMSVTLISHDIIQVSHTFELSTTDNADLYTLFRSIQKKSEQVFNFYENQILDSVISKFDESF